MPSSSAASASAVALAEESYAALRNRAERAELQRQRATRRLINLNPSATYGPNGERPPSILGAALSGGGTQQLAAAATANVPLTIQLMLPVMLLMMLFGILIMIAYAMDFFRGKEYGDGEVRGSRGHRRTASGDPLDAHLQFTPPRRGFAFSGSWADGLEEGGGSGGAAANGSGGVRVAPAAQQGGFALPPSFVSHPSERLSPGRKNMIDV